MQIKKGNKEEKEEEEEQQQEQEQEEQEEVGTTISNKIRLGKKTGRIGRLREN